MSQLSFRFSNPSTFHHFPTKIIHTHSPSANFSKWQFYLHANCGCELKLNYYLRLHNDSVCFCRFQFEVLKVCVCSGFLFFFFLWIIWRHNAKHISGYIVISGQTDAYRNLICMRSMKFYCIPMDFIAILHWKHFLLQHPRKQI